MKTISLIIIALQITLITLWAVNLYKFTQCDFKSSYKGEILHGVGLFTPVFIVTAFMELDK